MDIPEFEFPDEVKRYTDKLTAEEYVLLADTALFIHTSGANSLEFFRIAEALHAYAKFTVDSGPYERPSIESEELSDITAEDILDPKKNALKLIAGSSNTILVAIALGALYSMLQSDNLEAIKAQVESVIQILKKLDQAS